MNILDSIMNAGNGAAVRQIGSQVGLDEAQTAAALSALVPALSAGVRQNLQTPDGLSGLIGALSAGNHQRYVDSPTALGDAGTVADGNGILGHIFGSKDVSRRVAARDWCTNRPRSRRNEADAAAGGDLGDGCDVATSRNGWRLVADNWGRLRGPARDAGRRAGFE